MDTSVLVDIALTTRSRHADAVVLAKCLRKLGITIRAPMHVAYEFMSAVRNEVHQSGGRHSSSAAGSNETERIDIWPVPIDAEFIERYPTGRLPDVRSGDLLFLAMAIADGQPLITEDQDLLKKARQAGASAFTITEYLTGNCAH